jgi:hypothetical protein
LEGVKGNARSPAAAVSGLAEELGRGDLAVAEEIEWVSRNPDFVTNAPAPAFISVRAELARVHSR